MTQALNAIPNATTTADVLLISTPCRFSGFSVKETAGAVATVVFKDGGSGGVDKCVVNLAAAGSSTVVFPRPVNFNTNLYLDRLTGTTEVIAYIE